MKPEEILGDSSIGIICAGIAGAYAGRLLSDFGAHVTLLEPPQGLPLRRRTHGPADTTGPLFRHLSAGMRSVTTDDGLQLPVAEHAIRRCDALIVDGLGWRSPSVAETLRRCRSINERATVVSLTPFGLDIGDPERPATEFTLQARAGSTGSRGSDVAELYAAGGRLGEWFAGCTAAVAVLSALGPWGQPAAGATIDISALEAMVLTMNPYEWIRGAIQDPPGRIGPWTDVPSVEQVGDGWVGFAIVTPAQWSAFVEMTEAPELGVEPSWGQRMANRSGLRDLVERAAGPWLKRHTVAEVVGEARARRIPVTEIGSGATLLGFDHLQQRDMFRRSADGTFTRPAPPYRIDGARPVRMEQSPAPGQHDADEFTVTPAASLVAADSTHHRPLAGVRVLDLTAFLAGPQVTWVLGILGAEIIKVEGPKNPDGMRRASARDRSTEEWWEYSPIHQGTNGGKSDIVLDLATPLGRELLLKMLPDFDMLVENFHPDVMTTLGLEYETVRAVRDDIIMLRMPAFGLDGPWRDGRAFAPTMDHTSGLAWLTGPPHKPPITPRAFSDTNAAWHAVVAALAALRRRAASGEGALIELAAVEAAVSVAAEQVVEYSAHGVLLERQGNDDPDAAHQGLYATASGDVAAVTIRDAQDMERFRRHFGDDSTPAEAIASMSSADGARTFRDLGIPFEIVLFPSDVDDDEILGERRYFVDLAHRIHGSVSTPTLPFTLGGLRLAPQSAAPTFGEHNHLLPRFTGLELDVLADAGVTADEPTL